MTVSNLNDRDSFEGDGAQTVFAFSFRCVDDTHVHVFINSMEQFAGFKVKRDISGVGGTITFTVAPANGVLGDIIRQADLLQNDGLGVNDSLNPQTLENMIDKLTIIAQQFSSDFAGVVRLAASIDPNSVDTLLPDYTAGYLIGWDIDSQSLRSVSPITAFNDLAPTDIQINGDVFGPASAVNRAVALFDTTTGKLLKGLASAGTANQVLTSNGAGADPTFKDIPATPPASPFVMPSGSIMFFASAAHIPAGWVQMTGQTVTVNGASFVTPDTRGHYLMCASTNDTGSAGYTGCTPGSVAGSQQHSHSQSGTFTTASSGTLGAGINVAAGVGSTVKQNTTLAHTHTVSISGNTGSMAVANRPLQVALLACIKVD